MKAKSIAMIRGILQQNAENARYHYNVTRAALEEKYGTEWIDSRVTAEEKEMLYDDKKNLREAEELLEDFENHQC